MQLRNFAAAFVFALGAACAVARADGDLLERKDGKFNPPIKGERPTDQDFEASKWSVVAADSDSVTYRIENVSTPQTMPSAQVEEIHLRPRTIAGSFRDAAKDMAAGSYDDAARYFTQIGMDAKNPNTVLRQKALFSAARCMMAKGDSKAAVEGYNALFAAFPKTFYTRKALTGLQQAYLEMGDEKSAGDAIAKLLALPGVSDSDRAEAEYARIAIDFRKADAARDAVGVKRCQSEYEKLASSTGGKADLARVHSLASIGAAKCAVVLGDPAGVAEAKKTFQRIAFNNSADEGLVAAAFIGLTECLFREGTPESKREALRCALRVRILYQDVASADEVAEALYYAARIFSDLAATPDAKERMRRERNECTSRFPNSIWAKKCKDELR